MRNREGGLDQDADLMTRVHETVPRRWLDLADDLEALNGHWSDGSRANVRSQAEWRASPRELSGLAMLQA
jgi:hypothetical protein